MSLIGAVVANLHQLETIVPTVQDLGRRHAGYGVVPSDYKTVGAALVWTFEQTLDDDFTAQTRDAWVERYTTLASTMQEAAAETR